MVIDRKRFAVALCGLVSFLDMHATQSLVTELAREFRAGITEVGLTISAVMLAVALVAPLVGALADVVGRKRVIVAGAVLVAAPTALAASAGSLDVLIAWRFLQGIFLPTVFTVAVAHIAEEWPRDEAADVTGLYISGSVLGGFLGRFLSAQVAEMAGWRASFLVLAIITLACAAVMAAWLPKDSRKGQPLSLRGLVAGFALHGRNPRLLLTCLVGGTVLFSIIATFTFVNYYLVAAPFGLSTGALGWMFAVYLFGVAAAPLSGPLIRRLGRRAAMALCVAITCAGLVLTLVPWLPAVIAGLAVFASAVFINHAAAMGYVGQAAQQSKAAAVGLYVTCYYLGGALGALLPVGAWELAGWPGTAGLIAGVELAALAVAAIIWRPGRAPEASPA